MKNKKSYWAFLALLLISGESYASFNYKSIQLGGVYATQDSSSTGGGVVRYLPTYQLNEKWSAGLSLDAALLTLEDDKNFVALGYMAFIQSRITEKFSLQLHAGAQTWTCDDCSTDFVAGPVATYDLGIEKAPWLKNVWVGYLPVFNEEMVHEVQLGVGLQF